MSIDPLVLAKQRRQASSRASCMCMECKTCQKREWMRKRRAGAPARAALLAAAISFADAESAEEDIAAYRLIRAALAYARPAKRKLTPLVREHVIERAKRRLAARGYVVSEAA